MRDKKCVISTFCGLRSQTSSGTSTREVTVLSLHDSSPKEMYYGVHCSALHCTVKFNITVQFNILTAAPQTYWRSF